MISARYWLRRLLTLHETGVANFPLQMGLSDTDWCTLLAYVNWSAAVLTPAHQQRLMLLSELQSYRQAECDQLAYWLFEFVEEDAVPMHRIIASASLGFNHLWQDLGLDSRSELRELMTDCFPSLVALNVNNMRWKKFFYRQRCLHREGEVVCRSPSCDDCCEWSHCFAPEV
ncbi:nitrogen fixation protein NifQ [Pectobacterium sp. B2J-2]|uniref:nitrogen fixation protein NifQ n=1 Tax=Pectobacterium sp. B2J-2 TaxID=3385372 RepID=UPI0038FC95CC